MRRDLLSRSVVSAHDFFLFEVEIVDQLGLDHSLVIFRDFLTPLVLRDFDRNAGVLVNVLNIPRMLMREGRPGL